VLANYLIGLREGLEATLVVVILVAYLVKSQRRGLLPRIWAGVGIAVAISLAFGALLTFGPRGMSGEAQEALGGFLSVVAVGFVTWMVMWMARSARHLSGELKGQVDKAALAGGLSLVLVAMLAVGREGLETALFLWAATQAAGSTPSALVGAGLGLLTAVVLGYLFYRGAVKINLSKFFTWTGAILIVVAAGVLSYGVHDLQEGGVLPGLNSLAFDLRGVFTEDTWVGSLLKGTLNFTPDTTWLQAVVWVVYVAVAMPTFFAVIRRSNRPARAAATAAPVAPAAPAEAARSTGTAS
jgi:high-affinity iron transporter